MSYLINIENEIALLKGLLINFEVAKEEQIMNDEMSTEKAVSSEKAFEFGRDVGLDSIERLGGFDREHEQIHALFAGLMSTVFHALYVFAPNYEAAEHLIETARSWGKEEATNEKGEAESV
ncbi:MAG: hypothetical protein QF569_26820 [Candidatus Poribacteria bacterium]|nr:hypothetical protein [Candidatus Poribacteria bacterium]